MEDGLIRHRIALLPFDEVSVLSAAAHDLIVNGFTVSQFCVLGPPEMLLSSPWAGKGWPAGEVLTELWSHPPVELKLTDAGPITMRCGHRAAVLFGPGGMRPAGADWIRPDLLRTLERSIEHGRVVLVIAAHSATQHALGARILLRHGKYDLQTHEFSARDHA